METTIIKDKEIKEISLQEIVLTKNVRHAHLWHHASYDPESIKNYEMKDLVAMAITIVDNVVGGKHIFDNEPTVFLTENEYEVQTGSTRAITAKNLEIIIKKNKDVFKKLYSDKELAQAYKLATANFVQLSESLTDAEKRRENNVRSDQHWLATAMGYNTDLQKGETLKNIARIEGKSPAKVRELANLEHLSGKAKTLCSKGVIGERVAIHLSKLPKVDQKLVIEYIEEKEIDKITNPKHLMTVLESSYTVLPDSYPFDAFEYKGKEYPPIADEAWYYKIDDGSLFVRHLSKNEKKSDLRLDVYCSMCQDEIFKEFPDAKLVNTTGKSMVVTEIRKCMHANPLIVNGHTLKFGCSDSSCETHTFKVDTTVVEAELKEKLHTKEVKGIREGMFSTISRSISDNLSSTFTLMMVIMQMMYGKLNAKAKTDVLLYIVSLLDEDEKSNIVIAEANIFDFSNLIKKKDFHLINIVQCETIISLIAARWLRDNPNVSFEEPLFNEFGLDFDYGKEISKDVLDTVENVMAKKVNKVSTKNKKFSAILDVLVHELGISTNENAKLKAYLISDRHSNAHPQKVELVCKKDVYELKYPNVDEEYLWRLGGLAKSLGFGATVTHNVTTQRRMLKLINRRINEFAPFVKDHWNEDAEKISNLRNEKYFTAVAIYRFAIDQFKLMESDILNGVGTHSIATTIEEGINKNFEASLTRELKILETSEYFQIEELLSKSAKKIPILALEGLASHWFPGTVIYPCLDAKAEEETTWVKTGEDENSEVWKQVKKDEVAKQDGRTWIQQLGDSIDILCAKSIAVVKISDPTGEIVGLAHYFGKSAEHYRVIYSCENEDTINYLGQKDYEYVFANDQEDWDGYSAMIVGPSNRIVTYDLIMASVSKCVGNFTIAYAFNGKNLTKQPWWKDLAANNPDIANINEESVSDVHEVKVSAAYLDANIKEGVFMSLSEEGRRGMYLIDMEGQGTYAVINIDNEWMGTTESTDEEE